VSHSVKNCREVVKAMFNNVGALDILVYYILDLSPAELNDGIGSL